MQSEDNPSAFHKVECNWIGHSHLKSLHWTELVNVTDSALWIMHKRNFKCEFHTKNNFRSDQISSVFALNLHLPNQRMNSNIAMWWKISFISFSCLRECNWNIRLLSLLAFLFIRAQMKTINKIWIEMPFGLPLFQSKKILQIGIIWVFENWFEVCGIFSAFNTFLRQKRFKHFSSLLSLALDQCIKSDLSLLFFV